MRRLLSNVFQVISMFTTVQTWLRGHGIDPQKPGKLPRYLPRYFLEGQLLEDHLLEYRPLGNNLLWRSLLRDSLLRDGLLGDSFLWDSLPANCILGNSLLEDSLIRDRLLGLAALELRNWDHLPSLPWHRRLHL